MKADKNIAFASLSEEELLDKRMKKKKRNKALTITLIVIGGILAFILLVFGGIRLYVHIMASKITYEVDGAPSFDETADDEAMDTDAPPPPPDDNMELPPIEIIENWFDGDNIAEDYEEEVLNVLLVGDDSRAVHDRGRSDTMILMSINRAKGRIVFTSFMRDSYIELPGYNYNRINAAYSKGGGPFLIETIETNFGIDIDYYAKVGFESFKEAIDAIGGMTLTVNDVNYNYFYDWSGIKGLSRDEACDGTHTVHLDGEDALLYARIRKGDRVDHKGDFGRTEHQRDFLTQFVNNCKGASFGELHDMLNVLLPYIATDMPQSELESHVMKMLTYVSYNVTNGRVPCAGTHEYYTTSGGAEVLNINVSANSKYLKAIIYG